MGRWEWLGQLKPSTLDITTNNCSPHGNRTHAKSYHGNHTRPLSRMIKSWVVQTDIQRGDHSVRHATSRLLFVYLPFPGQVTSQLTLPNLPCATILQPNLQDTRTGSNYSTGLLCRISAMAFPRSRCQLLELPQEMRDEIYGYVFSSDDNDAKIRLLRDAEPPSKALCCVSQQIYYETRRPYNRAFRAFWMESYFHISLFTPEDFLSARSLNGANIDNIRNISIEFDDSTFLGPRKCLTLQTSGQMWTSLATYNIGMHRIAIYADSVIGANKSTGETCWIALGASRGTPKPELNGAVVADLEVSTREQHHLEPALPLSKQILHVIHYATKARSCIWEEYWKDIRSQLALAKRIIVAALWFGTVAFWLLSLSD